MKKIRTRYAPSPTGLLHIGGARTALFSYLFAKHYDGDFIIRIEDTDLVRNIKDNEVAQLNDLNWLGINADESPQHPNPKYGPYHQSKKLDRYNYLINKLIASGHAYKAYDNYNELQNQKKEQKLNGIFSFRYDKDWLKISKQEKEKRDKKGHYVIRFKLPKDEIYFWDDIVRNKIVINSNDIGDFIIKKENQYPTYNFAVVVDDHDMEISHVLRGEEHISNTPKQIAIYKAFNWTSPQFGHLTTIINEQGKKLSKRDTSLKQFISDYRNDGYINKAIFNFLTLIGWNHPHKQEKMTKAEIIKAFDPTRFSKSPSKFDLKKMQWFAKKYMQEMPNDKIISQLNFKNKDKEWIELFINTYKKSAINFKDFVNAMNIYKNKEIKNNSKNIIIITFKEQLNKQKFTLDGINKAIKKTEALINAKRKKIFMTIREAITYQKHGPELAKAIYLFGEKIIKDRLNK